MIVAFSLETKKNNSRNHWSKNAVKSQFDNEILKKTHCTTNAASAVAMKSKKSIITCTAMLGVHCAHKITFYTPAQKAIYKKNKKCNRNKKNRFSFFFAS
jgi:hypothetical protein